MDKKQMRALISRGEDLLMQTIGEAPLAALVAPGLTPQDVAEIAHLLDVWLHADLMDWQYLRARELADLAGISLQEVDRIAVEQEKSNG
jgi:hypothetical protein